MSLMIGLEKIKFRYAVWLAYNRMVDEKSWLDCGCSSVSDVGSIFFSQLGYPSFQIYSSIILTFLSQEYFYF